MGVRVINLKLINLMIGSNLICAITMTNSARTLIKQVNADSIIGGAPSDTKR